MSSKAMKAFSILAICLPSFLRPLSCIVCQQENRLDRCIQLDDFKVIRLQKYGILFNAQNKVVLKMFCH